MDAIARTFRVAQKVNPFAGVTLEVAKGLRPLMLVEELVQDSQNGAVLPDIAAVSSVLVLVGVQTSYPGPKVGFNGLRA